MIILLTVLHILFCLFLILAILLQTGKGGGMGAAFGGGGSSTVFGPRGAGSFIGKLTGTVATLFMLSSMALAAASSSQSTGVAEKAALAETGAGPAEDVDLDEARRIAGAATADKEVPAAPGADAAPTAAPDAGEADAAPAPIIAPPATPEEPASPPAEPAEEGV
ncbi:MAG TPA: preprotein translocase subunit SecG [Polyangia bacterium]|nr:preprotein translocase subunit SecG [Polyangia bacterium]